MRHNEKWTKLRLYKQELTNLDPNTIFFVEEGKQKHRQEIHVIAKRVVYLVRRTVLDGVKKNQKERKGRKWRFQDYLTSVGEV